LKNDELVLEFAVVDDPLAPLLRCFSPFIGDPDLEFPLLAFAPLAAAGPRLRLNFCLIFIDEDANAMLLRL
jgi:hypothetical protein